MPNLHVETPKPIRLRVVERDGPIRLHVGEHYDVMLPMYDGPYESTPTWGEQVYGTADKRMTDDFTVHSILELEVANEAGGLTLTI